MHAEINVRFEISIDEQKELSLATLAEFITDQQVESLLLESIVESLDASCVEALCGEKHAHGNGNKRFQRACLVLPPINRRYRGSHGKISSV